MNNKKKDTIVHAVHAKRPLCGFSEYDQADWPERHKGLPVDQFVRELAEDAEKMDGTPCEECVTATAASMPTKP